MKRFACALLLAVVPLCLVSALPASEILTNDTVVTMVKAGLGEELIISKVKSSQNQFDLSTDSMLKLKREGVSEKVIQAMLESTSKPGPAEQKGLLVVPTHPMAAFLGLPPAVIASSTSLYVRAGGKVVEMPPLIAETQLSRGKFFIPYYFGPGDVWHYIRGPKSVVRLTDRRPVFYTRLNPSAFLLVKLSYQSSKDIRYVVSTGATYRNTVSLTSNKKSEEFFELAPGGDLEPGEYAVVSSGTFYDFGVE